MFDTRQDGLPLQPATQAASEQAAAARCMHGVAEEQHASKDQGLEHSLQWQARRPEQERQQEQQEQLRQRDATGFARWSRTQRAKADTFGYILSLVFHLVTLSKYQTLPASHIVYYTAYTVATACLLAWQRSERPSYAAWRDWVQAAIRLDVFLSPPRVVLWQHSLNGPPPGLSSIAALPVLFSNTLAVHLLMLPFAHSLGLWPHLLVQAISVSKVVFEVLNQRACQRAVFQHPATQVVVEEAYWGLKNLRAFSFRPNFVVHNLGPNPAEQHCTCVILWLVLVVGFWVSVAAQAWLDGTMFRAFLQARRQQQQQQQQHGGQHGGQQDGEQLQLLSRQGRLLDSVLDGLSGRYMLQVVGASRRPVFWLLMSVAVWDVLAR